MLGVDEALAVVRAQDERNRRSLQVDVAMILGLWGVAWLGGFGVTYFAYGETGVAEWLAIAVSVALNVVAAVTSFSHPLRRGRGIEGPSRQVMLMYMWAWPVAFAGLSALNAGLAHQGMPVQFAALLWPASSAGTVGILYLAAATLFRDVVLYGLGTWMLIVGAASVFAGAPANFAVLSLAGGGGFLAAAAWHVLNRKRAPA